MLATLVLPPLVGFWLLFKERYCCRKSLILAATAWGLLVFFITEGLSQARALNEVGLCLTWLLAGQIVFTVLIVRRLARGTISLQGKISATVSANQRDAPTLVTIGLIALLCVIPLAIALITPPANPDALT